MNSWHNKTIEFFESEEPTNPYIVLPKLEGHDFWHWDKPKTLKEDRCRYCVRLVEQCVCPTMTLSEDDIFEEI